MVLQQTAVKKKKLFFSSLPTLFTPLSLAVSFLILTKTSTTQLSNHSPLLLYCPFFSGNLLVFFVNLSMSSNAVFSSFLLLLLSHPLYLSYFVFFLPYILTLLRFLSPLFFTTFLLLFASLSGSPEFMHPKHRLEFAQSKMGFLSTTYQVIYESLRPRVSQGKEDVCPRFEELEAYKMVFESYTFETSDIPAEVEIRIDTSRSSDLGRADEQLIHGIKDVADDQERREIKTKTETKRLPCKKMEYEVKAQGVEADKVEDKCRSSTERGSKAKKDDRKNGFERDEEETALEVAEDDNRQEKESNLGSFGSMRREKEWRRTLACKLFEERQNVNGSEGMDMLWETYEKQSDKVLQLKSNRDRKKVEDIGGKEEEEEEEERQMCCLQALKFSGGKTNVGIGRTNLVKISKVLKGIGWFNQHSKIK